MILSLSSESYLDTVSMIYDEEGGEACEDQARLTVMMAKAQKDKHTQEVNIDRWKECIHA